MFSCFYLRHLVKTELRVKLENILFYEQQGIKNKMVILCIIVLVSLRCSTSSSRTDRRIKLHIQEVSSLL